MKKTILLFRASAWPFFFLLILLHFTPNYSRADIPIQEITQASRLLYLWTPVHESTVERALEAASTINLEGNWKFLPDPDSTKISGLVTGHFPLENSASIHIPAACIGWGFQAEKSAAFIRTFDLADSWSSRNILLKSEGMFERAQIFINGHIITEHIGWTPFERDITNLVHPGQNQIIVLITMQGYAPANRLRIRKGGYPDTGGILRPLLICSVPKTHVRDLFLIPKQSKSGNWSLEAQIVLANTSNQTSQIHLRGSLRTAEGGLTDLPEMDKTITVPPQSQVRCLLSDDVKDIGAWSAESPNLYYFILSINDGKNQTFSAERFGFRTAEIRGEQYLLNGKPIFLRGIGYKGGHADYGNASPRPVLEQEMELMKQANVNTVRLGWAFKSPDLHRVCDEKGIYVISGIGGDQYYLNDDLHLQQYFEAFNCLKNCPSVLIWELMNENPRVPTPAIKKIIEVGKQIDPYRKFCHPGASYKELDFICPHYQPGLFAADRRDGRPFLPTEYAHTPAYELDKLKLDPGIHDLWGYSIKRGWDIVRQSPWVIGIITFAWRDPCIRNAEGEIIPALHNEAKWGIVNELFHKKPEYDHLFKVYSPVQVLEKSLTVKAGETPELTLENGYDFTNLKQLNITWRLLDSGKLLQQGNWEPDLPPHKTGQFKTPAMPDKPRSTILQLIFKDKDRLVQRVEIPFRWPDMPIKKETPAAQGKTVLVQDSAEVEIKWDHGSYFFDRESGTLCRVRVGDEELMLRGLDLNQRIALPAQGRWFDWKNGNSTATTNWTQRVFSLGLKNMQIIQSGDSSTVVLSITHRYSNGDLETRWAIFPDGRIKITATLPPQGYGLSLRFPVFCRTVTEEMKSRNLYKRFAERLAWCKNSLWSWLPEDHLGRNIGIASLLNPHDPQNNAMKINTAYFAVGPDDKSINLIISDPQARIHTRCHSYYNEFELFIQGRLEDDYDYFDRTNPLRAMPQALDEQRTYSFFIRFVDKNSLEQIEKVELDPYYTLVSRAEFWDNFHDDLSVGNKTGSTVKGLTPFYKE
ncbi:hypothetical protein JXQ31_12360 [candidate division KSB1 bacterium]|nr:hypothetical protein [candidate division KSB1 bacterium]